VQTAKSLLSKLPLALLLASAACSGEGSGSVQVFVEPEDTIPLGLTAGTGPENIQDGWNVSYDRFLVVIGNVRASRSDSGEQIGEPNVFVLDLKRAPAGGYVIASFDDLAAVRWDRFGFDLPNAKDGVTALSPTSDTDLALMRDNGYSVYIEGSIQKTGGESCPPGQMCHPAEKISFRWGLPAGTSFDDCGTEDGLLGFAVPSGSSVQVKPTIHGDHWFFSNFTGGAELTARRAQYIADSDIDGDGETTLDELKAVKVQDVFTASEYNLSGALGGPVDTAYDYVLAQARTLGDFQGDGECPTRSILP